MATKKTQKPSNEEPFDGDDTQEMEQTTEIPTEQELLAQAAALGMTIETTEEPQVSNSAEAKAEANLILPIVRMWLGQTAQRDLYLAHRRQDWGKTVVISISYFCEELSKSDVMKKYTQLYLENMCRDPRNKRERMNEAIANLQILLKKLEDDKNWKISKWALIRALNQAISRTNYGHFMKEAGFIYTGDSDHKITQVQFSGEYKWTEPEKFTLGIRPAETEEEYTKPFFLQDIPDPDNDKQTIKVRVYRRSGNVIHPSSSVSKEELDRNDPLYLGLLNLQPGNTASKLYDSDLHISEFERLAEQDIDFCIKQAEERNIKLWPTMVHKDRMVILYHAGYLDPSKEDPTPSANSHDPVAIAS